MTKKDAYLYMLICTVMLALIGCLSVQRAVAGELAIAGKAQISTVKPSAPIPAEKRAAADSLTIADQGQARMKIVWYPESATASEVRAVEELLTYLSRITGAEFEVVEDRGKIEGPGIYVGVTSQGRDYERYGEEECVVKTVGKNIIIKGGRPRGTLYGVYVFLEEVLGVRWYTPWYEKVPRLTNCVVGTLNIQRKPAFNMRDLGGGLCEPYQNVAGILPPPYEGSEQWRWWRVRNRISLLVRSDRTFDYYPWYRSVYLQMGEGWAGVGSPSHSFSTLVPPAKYFKDHPEYYSMRSGKRVAESVELNGKKVDFGVSGNQLCLTNEELRELVKRTVLDYFRMNPFANWASVSPNDGGCNTFCDCEKCRAFVAKHGTEADLYTSFVNPIAEAVEKEFPGKYVVTMYGYGPARKEPPKTFKPRDNVIDRTGNWSGVFKQMWYWAHWDGVDAPFMCVMPYWWNYIDGSIKSSKEMGFTGYYAEAELVFRDPLIQELHEMQMWLFGKLTEDPKRNVDELMSDFVNGYFETAGPYIYEYLMLQKERYPLWPWRMINYEFLHKAQTLFDKAEAEVAKKPELLARVKDLRINIDMASLILRNNVMCDYVRQGGKLEDYPYKRDLLRKRILERLEQTAHPYWRAKSDAWIGVGSTTKLKRNITAVETLRPFVELLGSGGIEYAPLPEQVKNIPFEQIVDAPFGANTTSGEQLITDADAVLGVTRSFDYKKMPFETGIYSHNTPAGFLAEPLLLGRQDIKTDGRYHLYKGSRFIGRPQTRIYLTGAWEAGMAVPYDPAESEPVWEYYISLKVTGFDDKSAEPAGIFVDRVVLVNLGSAKELRAKGQEVPPYLPLDWLAGWGFEENGFDSSPDGSGVSNAEISGGTWVEGRFGKAFALSKPTDGAVVRYDNKNMTVTRERLNFSKKSFTISLWFQTQSSERNQVLLEQRADNSHFFTLFVNGSKMIGLQAFDAEAGKTVTLSLEDNGASFSDGKWHHVVVGYDKDKKQLFARIDGKGHKEIPLGSIPAIEAPIRMGSGQAGFLHGALDEVRIYGQALPTLHGGMPTE